MLATTMYVIAAVFGLFGGILHQLHDSEEKNNVSAIGRSALFGLIAGVLTVAITPITNMGALMVSTFITGWFGDSIVLNIVRRGRK